MGPAKQAWRRVQVCGAGPAASVKPKTWAGYRDDLRRYVLPHIGRMRLQAVKPATLSRLYADLLKSGGRKGSLWRLRRSVTCSAL
jgi:hypothetical protein